MVDRVTPMLEKMARAMHEWPSQRVEGAAMTDMYRPAWEDIPQRQRDKRLADARAALLAMREPDGPTMEAGAKVMHAWERNNDTFDEGVVAVHTAMIDAILGDDTP